jgi:hypothetical protein
VGVSPPTGGEPAKLLHAVGAGYGCGAPVAPLALLPPPVPRHPPRLKTDSVAAHLEQLEEASARPGGARERLEAVLETFALILHDARGRHDAELEAFLHRDEQVAAARNRVRAIIEELVSEGAETGELRDEVAPAELASYCLHALSAARSLPSQAAVRRLVAVTLAGLTRPADDQSRPKTAK